MAAARTLFRLGLSKDFIKAGVNRRCSACCFSSSCPPSAPLDGIKVLDLTRVLAGPYCTMIMGDLGAEVIKVEKPGSGDDTRSWGPPFVSTESAYFISVNRNKKSIAIDLKKPQGAKIVQELAKQSDVLVENYIPGKLGEMGLGYEQLKVENPGLVYCSITGYGQTGPDSQRGGYDVIVSGAGGLLQVTGPEGGEPCRVGVAMTDLSTGLYAWGAILTALMHRAKTGEGQHIDCNLLSTQVATMTHIASNYLNCGWEAKRFGTGHPSLVPYQAFETRDGYMIIGTGNNQLFKEACERMGFPELPLSEKFKNNEDRVENRKELIGILSERFATKTNAEWMEIFKGSKFPYGPINNMEQVFSDPQVLHNNMIQTMQHSTIGEIRIPGPAVRYSASQVVLQNPAPTLGEHTSQILSKYLNMNQPEIQDLCDKQIIQ